MSCHLRLAAQGTKKRMTSTTSSCPGVASCVTHAARDMFATCMPCTRTHTAHSLRRPAPGGDIYQASRVGDVERVKYLLEHEPVDVNKRDRWDSVPLYYACLAGAAMWCIAACLFPHRSL